MKIEITQTEIKPKDIAPGTLVQFDEPHSIYMVVEKETGRKALLHSEEFAKHRFYILALTSEYKIGEILYSDLSKLSSAHILEQVEPLKLKVIS